MTIIRQEIPLSDLGPFLKALEKGLAKPSLLAPYHLAETRQVNREGEGNPKGLLGTAFKCIAFIEGMRLCLSFFGVEEPPYLHLAQHAFAVSYVYGKNTFYATMSQLIRKFQIFEENPKDLGAKERAEKALWKAKIICSTPPHETYTLVMK